MEKTLILICLLFIYSCTENTLTPDSNLPAKGIFYKTVDSTLIRYTSEEIATFKDTIIDNNGNFKVVDRFRVSTIANFKVPNNSWTVKFYKGISLNNLEPSGSWGSFGEQAWKIIALEDSTTSIFYIVWKKEDVVIYSVGFRVR